MSHTEDVRDKGATPAGSGSRRSDQAAPHLDPSGFDPLRKAASRLVAPPKRVRKCWLVTWDHVADYATEHVYAPTRARAIAQVWRNVSEVWCDFTFKDLLKHVRVVRAKGRDKVLPDRHPLASQISSEILHCVVHAYGGTGLKAGYRDHFYTQDSDWAPKAAYYHGLFERYRVDKRMAGSSNMVMYELTTLGKNVARGEAETYPAF